MKEIRIMNIDERLKPIVEAFEQTPLGGLAINIANIDGCELTLCEKEDGTFSCPSEWMGKLSPKASINNVASKDIFKLLGYALTRKDRQS